MPMPTLEGFDETSGPGMKQARRSRELSNRTCYEMLLGSSVMLIRLKQSSHLQMNEFRRYLSCSQCVLVLPQISSRVLKESLKIMLSVSLGDSWELGEKIGVIPFTIWPATNVSLLTLWRFQSWKRFWGNASIAAPLKLWPSSHNHIYWCYQPSSSTKALLYWMCLTWLRWQVVVARFAITCNRSFGAACSTRTIVGSGRFPKAGNIRLHQIDQ